MYIVAGANFDEKNLPSVCVLWEANKIIRIRNSIRKSL